MDDKNFRSWCEALDGRYDQNGRACTLNSSSYNKLREIQEGLAKEAVQSNVPRNLRDVTSGRDTNIDSFDTFDEVLNKDGTVLIRRPNIVNIYDSVVKLSE
jgi:hypothetical protein